MLSGQRRPICRQRAPLLSWPSAVQVAQMSQEVRDAVGTLLLQLTLKELFQWRFMQTDPNWGNFLFDGNTGILHLIDFGEPPEITAWARVYRNEYSSLHLSMCSVRCHHRTVWVWCKQTVYRGVQAFTFAHTEQALNFAQKGAHASQDSWRAGAARDFPRPFVDDYLRMVRACAEHERSEIILRSTRMGFLTGGQRRPCYKKACLCSHATDSMVDSKALSHNL